MGLKMAHWLEGQTYGEEHTLTDVFTAYIHRSMDRPRLDARGARVTKSNSLTLLDDIRMCKKTRENNILNISSLIFIKKHIF